MPSDLEPVWNEAALRLRLTEAGTPHTYLVLGELHIGLESELARRGAFLKSRTRELSDRILRLKEATGATRLVLLGDVKHRVTHLSPQERRDVPAFFDALLGFDAIHIAVGNHDAGLRTLLPARHFRNVRFHGADGFLLRGENRKVGFLHGHAWPRPGLRRKLFHHFADEPRLFTGWAGEHGAAISQLLVQ